MTAIWLKWLPAAVVPAVIAGMALTTPFQTAATTDLPEKTPEQVLALVADSNVQAFSGTLEQSSQLGLPELPDVGGISGSPMSTGQPSLGSPGADNPAGPDFSGMDIGSILELLTGTHTARVYVDGPANARVQVLDSLAERDAIRHGDDVWFYDSADNSVLHLTLPEHAATPNPEHVIPGANALTPAELAHRMLAAVDSTTDVTVAADVTVAGRTAYELVLTPRTSETLVGSVQIAVDSETGFPLGVIGRAHV